MSDRIITGLAKYEEGLRLEAQGLSGAQVAKRLGYANAQSWFTTKSAYTRRAQGLMERAQARSDNTPREAGIMDGLPERVSVKNNPEPLDEFARKLLTISKQVKDRRERGLDKDKTQCIHTDSKPPVNKEAQAAAILVPDAYEVQGQVAYAVDSAMQSSLKPVSATWQGEIGRYTLDGDNIVISVRDGEKSVHLNMSRDQIKQLMTELFDLTALMEVG